MADDDNPYLTPKAQDAPPPGEAKVETYARPENDVAEDDEDAPPDEEMVAIATVLTVTQAEVLRSAIRGSGIRAYVRGLHANQVLGAAARVKVMVPEREADQAREILAQYKGNAGKPVFVVVGRPFGGYLLLGFIGGGIAGTTFYGRTGNLVFLILFTLVGLGFGLWRASAAKTFCSAPDCGKDLKVDATTCAACGGVVSGTIKHPNERLEAEERLHPGE